MQAVLLIGIQGSGKSTFYARNFASTHLRISMDLAKTRAREKRLIEKCLVDRREFVIDNTNPTVESRQPYINAAKAARYRIAGFYFIPDVKAALERNARRTGNAKIPVPGIYRTNKIMQMPGYGEGFDGLFAVRIIEDEFLVEPIAPDVT